MRPVGSAEHGGAVVLVVALAVSDCASVPVNVFDPLPRPDGRPHVSLHYLGNGGWVLQRGNDLIATAPFVSQPRWYPARSSISRSNRR